MPNTNEIDALKDAISNPRLSSYELVAMQKRLTELGANGDARRKILEGGIESVSTSELLRIREDPTLFTLEFLAIEMELNKRSIVN